TSISVSAADLGKVGYFTGPNGGRNNVACDVLANLGAVRNTKTITITVNANQPPVVTGSNHSYSTNQPVLASDLFQASDPDGSVASYRFYDSSPRALYSFPTRRSSDLTSISVSAADLGKVGYF